MKLPLSWLKEHAPLQAPADVIAETLIRLGHEVEAVESPRAGVRGVRVGQIKSMRPHPDADKLKLLQVDIGDNEPLAIVCGASNMSEGDKVPVATIGTSLPNGMRIKKGKIRGETSYGMCCSEAELGLAEDAAGLLILPADAPVGAEVGEYLGLEEAVFDLSITPNRGDCMNVRGLARDLAADAAVALAALPDPEVAVAASVQRPEIRVDAAQDCPLYLGRYIRGIRVGDSPAWMQARLLAAGQRPVNGVVDVLNYLMLDLGQPMHAFDANKINGEVEVRAARDGEEFTALDGRELKLHAGDLVISDGDSVLALAGIMGSGHSGVSDATTDILLESAFFRPARVSTTRRIYAMVSEASMRFERGVDPAMVEYAMQRATAMIIELYGGEAGEIRLCGGVEQALAATGSGREIRCSLKRLEARLGIAIPKSCDEVLSRMGFDVRRMDDAIHVRVPSWRHDVALAEDISEEYARVIGFDAIPAVAPQPGMARPGKPDTALEDALVDGCAQVISYAFISEAEQRMFIEDDGKDIRLDNPLSDAMSVMRRSLWPGLLNIARYNMNRQQPGVALVEKGRAYAAVEQGHVEENMLAWLMAGELQRDEWYARSRQADFFDLKGAIEAWLEKRGLSARFVADDMARGLQPGQSAQIWVGRGMIGRMGRVDAAIAAGFDLDMPVYVAEVSLDALPRGKARRFVPLPEYPGFERDLVFIFDRHVQAEAILQCVRKAGGKLLTDVRIFDRYEGKGIPGDKVSLGIRFTLQAPDRTLTQADSEQAMQAIARAVEESFGASLRG